MFCSDCQAAAQAGFEQPDYDRVAESFAGAYSNMCKEHPCFGYDQMSGEEWWRRVVYRTFKNAEYIYPDDKQEEIFQTIYASFGSLAPYKTFDDVHMFLQWARQEGYLLGIISNCTKRYRNVILPLLKLDQYFDFMVLSKEVGEEKPSPVIFEEALKLAGNPAPETVFHIGDSKEKDWAPAVALGMV